jgi:hypothetical protein
LIPLDIFHAARGDAILQRIGLSVNWDFVGRSRFQESSWGKDLGEAMKRWRARRWTKQGITWGSPKSLGRDSLRN